MVSDRVSTTAQLVPPWRRMTGLRRWAWCTPLALLLCLCWKLLTQSTSTYATSGEQFVQRVPPVASDNASLIAECLERMTRSGDRAAPEATWPDDIVLVVLTNLKRHGLVEMMRRQWLRDAKVLFFTDAVGIEPSANHKVVVHAGRAGCGAADRSAPAIYHANATFWGEYRWLLVMDDDTVASRENLAIFLSAYDPDLPLWFSAHGCDARYVPADAARSGERSAWPHGAPCVNERPPRGSFELMNHTRELGLRHECARRGGSLRRVGSPEVPETFRTECTAMPGVQALSTSGSEVGQTFCGGAACALSRGFMRAIPAVELFRGGSACQGCTPGQQDVMFSRCLWEHNVAAVGPIGVPGFFWGRPAERLVEQLLGFYPECLAREPGARGADACQRRHGLAQWFTAHLQVRGAWTTLHGNASTDTPQTWNSKLHRLGGETFLIPDLLRRLYEADQEDSARRALRRPELAARVCCSLVHRAIVPCHYGCVPWRLRPMVMPQCADAWGSPVPRDGSEKELLPVDKKQHWPSGAMRCDLCDGYFRGWRGRVRTKPG